MIRFMIFTAVNVRGYMVNYVKSKLPALEKKIGDEISIFTPHDPEYSSDCTEEWMSPAIKKGILPDITVTHATELASVGSRTGSGHFSHFAGKYLEANPVRNELKMLIDPENILYPISVTPLVMIYNTKKVKASDLNNSWTDLFNENYKVIFPDRDKPLSRATGAFLLSEYPKQFPSFEKRVLYKGSPADVVKAVASGEFDIGLSNISFASIAESKGGVAINNVSEGYILLPQVLVMKKDAKDELLALFDLMICEEIQQYLSEQGVWVVRDGIALSKSFAFDQQLAKWKGWDAYLRSVSEFDNYSV